MKEKLNIEKIPKEKNAYICPMCKGRKQIDLDKYGLYSPSDPSYFGECILCYGKGFIIA